MGAAWASGPWPLPFFTAEPKAVLAEAAKIHPPGAKDLVLLDSDCVMKINEQGRALTTCHFLFRPISKLGAEQIGTFQLPWAAWREQRPLLRIRVISPDASAQEFDPKGVTESAITGENQSVADSKLIEAPLPGVAVNSVVEIETVSQDKESPIPGSRFAYFQPDNLPTGHWRATVEAPAAMAMRVKAERLPEAQRTESRAGPLQRVTIEFSDTGVLNPAIALPPEASAPRRVAISAGAGWETIARQYVRITQAALGPAPAGLAISEAQRMATIGALLNGLHANIRANNFELGTMSYLPRTPREIAEAKSGDSLDLAVALAAKLRASGMVAYVALLTPFPGPDPEIDMPGIEAFTHAVVWVPGRQQLWIDPSAPFAVANRLPAADQGRMALVARPGVTGLLRTPVSTAAENRFTEYQNITLAQSGRGDIDEIEEGEGYFADAFRITGSALKSAPPAQLAPYEKSLAAAYGYEKTVQTDVINLTELTKPVRLVFSGTGYRNAVTEGRSATVYVPEIAANGAAAGGVLNPLIAAVKQDPGQTEDLYAITRGVVERRIHVAPVAGLAVRALPSLREVAIGPLTLQRQASVGADGSVEVVYHLEIARNRFTAAEVRAMAADMDRLAALPLLRIEFGTAGSPGSLEDLLARREYGRAADLLESGGRSAEAAMLRRTHRQEEIRNSDDPLVAVAQALIRGLLDSSGQRPWRIFYADGIADSVKPDEERRRLLSVLKGFRTIAGVTLNLDALTDVVLSNLQLSYTGSERASFRVRFPDPAHGGAMSTLGRFAPSGDSYRALGIGDEPDPTR